MSWRDLIAKAIAAGGLHTFHGSTERNLKSLLPSRGIETRGATFHASNPDVAETFTFPREYGEPMLYDEAGRELKRGRVYNTILTPRNMLEVPPHLGQQFIDDTAMQNQFVRDAINKGHDAVVARNVLEGIGDRYQGDVYATFDPSIAKIFGKYGVAGAAAPFGALAAQDAFEVRP